MRKPDELEDLRALSARIGSAKLVVQAAGGNTSIKDNNTLWIKASGTWLAHAMEKDIFVPVDMRPLTAAVRAGDPAAENAQLFTLADANPSGLRPSIETTVHVLLPQRVVVHVHCVDTIAVAVQRNGEAQLGTFLRGLNWAYVPYARPGLPLARGIAQHTSQRPDVVVLGNHGLVVAAETVAEAAGLLDQVRGRLKQTVRSVSGSEANDVLNRAGTSGYVLPQDQSAHSMAIDPHSLGMASGGSLYPDHVVFLGKGVTVAGPTESIADVAARVGHASPMILFPGLGLLMRGDATPAAHAMAGCLADVLVRIAEGAELNYLTDAENDELTNWDAEKYRQQLEAKSRAHG